MRITFISPPANMSGGVRVVAIYAQRLHERGHQVTIVYPRPKNQTFLAKLRYLIKKGRWPSTPGKSFSYFDGIDARVCPISRVEDVSEANIPDADVLIATFWVTAEWIEKISSVKGTKAYFLQH